jgi:hypothetical protein
MGFLSDLFFGSSRPVNSGKKETTSDSWNSSDRDYDDYYDQVYDDAMCGDLDAQAEMREEFGDGWEGEY